MNLIEFTIHLNTSKDEVFTDDRIDEVLSAVRSELDHAIQTVSSTYKVSLSISED